MDTGALVAYRNEVLEYGYYDSSNPTFSLFSGAVLSGSLDNLLTPQLSRGVVLQPWTTPYPGLSRVSLRARIPGGLFSVSYPSWQSERNMAVVGLLGLGLPTRRYIPADPTLRPRIVVSGKRVDFVTGTVWDTIGATFMTEQALSPFLDPRIDGLSSLTNRLLPVTAHSWYDNGSGLTTVSCPYNEFQFDLYTPTSGGWSEIYLGGVWISDAVRIATGIDGDWSCGRIDSGSVSFSRDGQAYPLRGRVTRQFNANISGPSITKETVYGKDEETVNDGQYLGGGNFNDMAQFCGATESVVIIPRIENEWDVRRQSVYGILQSPIEFGHLGGDLYSTRISVREIR